MSCLTHVYFMDVICNAAPDSKINVYTLDMTLAWRCGCELQYRGSVSSVLSLLSYRSKFTSKEKQWKTDTRTQVEYRLSLTPGSAT